MGSRGKIIAALSLIAATAAFSHRAHAGALTPMPGSLTFPNTGTGSQSATQSVQFTNTSQMSATVDSVVIGGANASEFVIVNPPGLPIALAPGASLPVDVAFE